MALLKVDLVVQSRLAAVSRQAGVSCGCMSAQSRGDGELAVG